MSDFCVSGGFPKCETWGVVSGSSAGTTVSSSTANVYGSWAELKAATGIEATYLVVTIADPNGGNQIDVDIGVGAAGSETVIAEALFLRADGYVRNNGMTYSIPVRVPSGSRVAARMRGAAASRSCQVSVRAFASDSPHASFQRLDLIGNAYVATTGYSAHTKGGWNQIVAASNAYKALHVVFGLIDFVSGQTSAALMDIGIGAAGNEVAAVPDLHVTAHDLSGASHNTYQNTIISGSIPASTRLSFRAQVSAGSSSRYAFMALYGYR